MSLWGLYIFLGVLAVAMIGGMWYVGKRARKREREIISSRSADTVEVFVASFRPELQPIARAMYTEFQPYTFSKKVPFQKSDRVAEILGFEKIDLDEPLKKVADQFGCRKPSKEDNNKFRARETFEDYVEFIHYLRSTESREEQNAGLHTH
jgi:hypothetical protein